MLNTNWPNNVAGDFQLQFSALRYAYYSMVLALMETWHVTSPGTDISLHTAVESVCTSLSTTLIKSTSHTLVIPNFLHNACNTF